MPKAGTNIRLTGWKAVVVVVFMVVIVVVKLLYAESVSSKNLTRNDVIKAIDPWVKAGASRQALDSLKQAVESNDYDAVNRLSRAVTGIEYKSISVKGVGTSLVVRAEITADGRPPADGRGVRYFRIEYDPLFKQWVCRGSKSSYCEVGEFSYRMALFTKANWD